MLPGKVAVDIPAAVKQQPQKGGEYLCDPDRDLFNRFELSENAPYIKELKCIFQA